MSAIAGYWHLDSTPDVASECLRMLVAQRVYGPDDGRHWSKPGLAMGRRLYRLLPEDIHDRQPLQSGDGRLTLIADVRLDNRDELIADLGFAAAGAQRLCDAAVLLACFERWGLGAIDRGVGAFALALWNEAERTLTLARDFRGNRPLHYHRGEGFFAFASMPKGLHALPAIPYAVDDERVAEFLALLPDHGARSFFKGIDRVAPGEVVTVTPHGLSRRRYWRPKRPSGPLPSMADCVAGLRRHLDQAVKATLRGTNGAVAAHLSGGFDSSAVAATAARLAAPSGGKVMAFTAVPRPGHAEGERRHQIGDEGPLAAATVAMHSNIEHVFVHTDRQSPLDGLDRNFFLFERPLLNLCNSVWGDAINRAVRGRGLAVLLVGQFGNMTLSYQGHELLPELMRARRLGAWWRVSRRSVAQAHMRWRGVLALTFGPFLPARLWTAIRRNAGAYRDFGEFSVIRFERLNKPDLRARAGERGLDLADRPRVDGFAARLWVMSRADPGMMTKGILAGWGIDIRDPTADKRLAEYCLGLPTAAFFADGVPRALAKHALADRVPQIVLNERRRGYQFADWHEGLTAARAEMAAEIDRVGACAPAARLLDIERMRRLVEDWPTGGWERCDVTLSYRHALLRGISAGHFLRKAMGANP